MYEAVKGSPRMTQNQATEHYPDHYILMQQDNQYELYDPMGTVLYIGDDGDELFSLQVKLPVPRGCVNEGINIQKRCIGGVVVGNRSI